MVDLTEFQDGINAAFANISQTYDNPHDSFLEFLPLQRAFRRQLY